MIKATAVILASGMSERMPEDKLHLALGNKLLYEHILDTVSMYPFREVIVAARDDNILAKAERLGFSGVKNTRYFLGQSESIKAALIVSKQTDGYMFFPADQPFISLSTISKLCGIFGRYPSCIVLPFYNGVKGSPVIFPYDLKGDLLNLEGDNGGRAIIEKHGDRIKKVPIFNGLESFDIDTPDDYERAKNINLKCEIE